MVNKTRNPLPSILDWFLDPPLNNQEDGRCSEGIILQGGVLTVGGEHVEAVVKVDEKVFRYDLVVNGPDVIQPGLNDSSEIHRNIKRGFHFRVPCQSAHIGFGFHVGGKETVIADVFLESTAPAEKSLGKDNPISDQKILFIHIPKTAGTSLRVASRKHFGDNKVLLDYGPNSEETSAEILKIIYEKNDKYQLAKLIAKTPQIFLGGHFGVQKYSSMFPMVSTVTFMRDPIQQVISHFEHFKNFHSYNESLEVFIEENRFKNMQSTLLTGRPIESLGFVGITEKYPESINHINRIYETNIDVLYANINPKKISQSYELDSKTIDLIESVNYLDIKMYKTACDLLNTRTSLVRKGIPFTYGMIQELSSQHVFGWAFYEKSDDIVEIEIYRNSERIGVVKAQDLRPGLFHWNPPRHGYIGFRYPFETPLKPDEELRCKVICSGQELNGRRSLDTKGC